MDSSILLQKQVRDNAKDLEDFCKDLKEWGDDMKKKDESLKRSKGSPTEVPPPKMKVSEAAGSNAVLSETKATSKSNKKIKGCDYAAWDKFDADGYCAKLDKEDADENSSPESELSDEIDETSIDLANCEKEKGNAFVKKQLWDQAIDCYTRAIECYAYDPIYYANRALCNLKKEKYREAESDCTTALQLDNSYVKAYQRRAAARENLNQISEAHSDLLKVLELEPKNKESKAVLVRIEKKLEKVKQVNPETIEEPRPVSKFTLSRQMHKSTAIEKNNGNTKQVPVAEHVVEHKTPSTFLNISKEQIERLGPPCISSPSQSVGTKISEIMPPKPSDNVLLAQHDMSNIKLFHSINIPPKTRSKAPLKRIKIIDVDLQTENQFLDKSHEKGAAKDEILKANRSNEIDKHDLEKQAPAASPLILNQPQHKKDKEKINSELQIEKTTKSDSADDITFTNLNLAVPKTSVQFYNSWKLVNSNKIWRKLYLLSIKPIDLPVIFKESLESNVFSQILETVNENITSNISLIDYLLALVGVKRFGALVMFMSSKDKKCVTSIVDYLKNNNTHYENTDIDKIIESYEL